MLRLTRQTAALLVILVVLAAVTATAWRQGDGRRPVEGIVTLDGLPLAGATVSFQPVPGNPSGTSGTTTDRGGRFTIPAHKGLMPGRYVVIVQKWKGTGQTFKDPRTGDRHEITAPISLRETENLEAIVAARGPNRFEFRVTSGK